MVGKTTGLWIAVLMLALANGLVLLAGRSADRGLRVDLSGLPGEIGGWRGGPALPAVSPRSFDSDDVLSRTYVSPAGERLWLSIAFWRRQREGRPVAFSPRQGHPGPEWKILSSQEAWIDAGNGAARHAVRQVIYQRFGDREAVSYWYIQGGRRVVTEWYMGRLAMVWDAVRWGRSDAALILLSSPVRQTDDAHVLEGQRQFAEHIAPLVRDHLPE